MKNEEIIEKIKRYNWYHEIEIKDGIKTSAVDAKPKILNLSQKKITVTSSIFFKRCQDFICIICDPMIKKRIRKY